MLRSPWEWLLLATVVGGPLAARLRGARGDRVFLLVWLHLVYGSLYILIAPEGKPAAASVAAIGLVGIDLVIRFLKPARGGRVVHRILRPRALAAIAVLTVIVVPMAGAEMLCRVLTSRGVLRYHQPIETVWKAGHDDWRMATITADIYREPDPVLLWRPVASRPYNAQRFKGPLIDVPKPPGVVRIFCYGDSLTDGPPRGDWPGRLHRLLNESAGPAGPRFEVINAGVAGYSSHQGLRRFLQEVDQYRPDLILAGFGWNDVAQAAGPPDREFRPPHPAVVTLQRAMVRYRSYLVLTAYLRTLFAEPPRDSSHRDNPRVSIPDYLANLERFRAEAHSRGVPIVYLTRPHQLPAPALRGETTWRRHVPEYNEALVAWGREQRMPVIDAQAYFEQRPRDLFSDECHFYPPGYEEMAELIRDRLLMGADPIFRLAADGDGLVPAAGGRPSRQRPVEQTASSREP